MRDRIVRLTPALGLTCALALVLSACAREPQATVGGTASGNLQETSAVAARLISPGSGTAIEGEAVDLALTAQGIRIVEPNGDVSGKTGHFRVFVDRDPTPAGAVISEDTSIVHSSDNPIHLRNLTAGKHRLVVVLGDGAHRRIGTTQAEITVEVKRRKPTATATATSTAKTSRKPTATASTCVASVVVAERKRILSTCVSSRSATAVTCSCGSQGRVKITVR